jgi:hypothetical protein
VTQSTNNIEQGGSVGGRVKASDLVERVATELETVWLYGQREGVDLWRALAAKSLEASHHAELVEALRLCRRFFVSKWSADEAQACLNELDALLAKIGGDA